MSNFIYSPSQNMIIPVKFKIAYEAANTWPDDGVEITDKQADEFSGQFPSGMTLGHNDNSMPCWINVPPPTPEEQLAAAESGKQRRIDEANNYINSKQWPGKAAIGRLKGDELAQYNIWLDYLDALELVDTSCAPNISWPTFPEG